MLFWVYTCQNATLLEILCHGSIIIQKEQYGTIHEHLVFLVSASSQLSLMRDCVYA